MRAGVEGQAWLLVTMSAVHVSLQRAAVALHLHASHNVHLPKQVSVRDFRSAFIDPLVSQQLQAIHVANTEFLDYLPKFCRDFLGVPVEEVSL